MIFVLDLRSRDRGGAVTSGVLSMQDGPTGQLAVDRMRLAQRVIFLAHGYNVDRREGRTKLTNLATFLGDGPAVAIVAVLWPGDSMVPVISYPLEGSTADDSARALASFIRGRNAILPGTPISVVTHSLGARVGLETLKRLLGSAYGLQQVCLMAPALVDYTLARPADYRATTLACERVAVLSSRQDQTLRWAFPVGNLLGVFPLFRNNSIGLALGYHRPRSVPFSRETTPDNVHAEAIASDFRVGHGDYLPDFEKTRPPPAMSAHDTRTQLAAEFAAKVLRGVPSPDF